MKCTTGIHKFGSKHSWFLLSTRRNLQPLGVGVPSSRRECLEHPVGTWQGVYRVSQSISSVSRVSTTRDPLSSKESLEINGCFLWRAWPQHEAREGKRGRRQVMSSWLVSQVSVTSPASPPPPCSPTSSNSTSLIQCQPLSRDFHQAHNWQQGGEPLHDLASSSQASGDVLLFIFHFILYWSIAN